MIARWRCKDCGRDFVKRSSPNELPSCPACGSLNVELMHIIR